MNLHRIAQCLSGVKVDTSRPLTTDQSVAFMVAASAHRIASESHVSYIKKIKGKYCVKSEHNPDWSGGCYDTKAEAEERLKQVEAIKHAKHATFTHNAKSIRTRMDPEYESVENFIDYLTKNDDNVFDYQDLNFLNYRTHTPIDKIKKEIESFGFWMVERKSGEVVREVEIKKDEKKPEKRPFVKKGPYKKPSYLITDEEARQNLPKFEMPKVLKHKDEEEILSVRKQTDAEYQNVETFISYLFENKIKYFDSVDLNFLNFRTRIPVGRIKTELEGYGLVLIDKRPERKGEAIPTRLHPKTPFERE